MKIKMICYEDGPGNNEVAGTLLWDWGNPKVRTDYLLYLTLANGIYTEIKAEGDTIGALEAFCNRVQLAGAFVPYAPQPAEQQTIQLYTDGWLCYKNKVIPAYAFINPTPQPQQFDPPQSQSQQDLLDAEQLRMAYRRALEAQPQLEEQATKLQRQHEEARRQQILARFEQCQAEYIQAEQRSLEWLKQKRSEEPDKQAPLLLVSLIALFISFIFWCFSGIYR
ncbi:MAG: hypothetical protein U0350_02075 [Caldilineaceae bacterium]